MNPLQKAAVRRKSFYFAAILALFTISIFYRGLEAKTPGGDASYVWMPFGGDERAGSGAVGNRLARQTIVSQSRRLELRELDEGEPDMTGEAVRLILTGSRGFAVTYLWWNAIEEQKRNDFHKFEQSIKAVTTLQPHFITPWIFQSWNVAYNVSVEMHSLSDMYFYIARGIDLLAEGERRNRRSPDMRYWVAFYYQNKFGVADQVQTLRCLFQLSCIPPDERNAENLQNPDGSVNLAAFKQFCEKHPMLVRRLRGEERYDKEKKNSNELLRMRKPEDVVQFLRDNRSITSRYKNATELKPAEQQFPALPPIFKEGVGEAHPGLSAADLGENFSGYLAARAWFKYANAIVPPNPVDADGNAIPTGVPQGFDPFKYRVPRMPTLIIFRQGPPRAQTYQAELMEKDGWFDGDGWEVDAGIDDANAWFLETVGGVRRKPAHPVVVGAGVPWSEAEWQKAYLFWSKHGDENGLSLRPNQLDQYRKDAGLAPGMGAPGLPTEPTPEQMANESFARRYRALMALFYYQANRSLTNFGFYLDTAAGERDKATIEARKTLWKADQERLAGNRIQSAKLYQHGLELWRGVLAANPRFHRNDRLQSIEEQTYEYELEYLRLIAEADPFHVVWKKAFENYAASYGKAARAGAAVIPFGAPGPAPQGIPQSVQNAWYTDTAEKYFSPFGGVITAQDVPAGDSRIGTPWITGAVKDVVLQRQGILRKSPTGPPAGMPRMSPPGR
jgi:hypothetical protein